MNSIMYIQFLTCPIFFFKESFIFLFFILAMPHDLWDLSFSFAVAKTFTTGLKRSGESGYPCLVPDFSRKAFSFYHWILYWLWVCHKSMLLCSFYTHFCKGFHHEWMLIFIKYFFCIYWYDHVGFVLFCWCGVSHCFQYTEPLSWPWNEFSLSRGVWPFLCVFGFCLLVWEFLCLYSSKLLTYNFLSW